MIGKNQKILIALCLLYIAPNLVSGFYYNDDMFRSVIGYYGWSGDGRPLADLIYKGLSLGPVLPDFFPIPLIMAILVYGFISLHVIEKTFNIRGYIGVAVGLSIICNPFFSSNLSYRYDSFFMVLSVCAAISPFLKIKNKIASIVLSVIFLNVSLSMYQASVSLYIIFSAIELLMLLNSNASFKLAVANVTMRVMVLFMAMAIYLRVVIPATSIGYYFSNFNKPLSISIQGAHKLIDNFTQAYGYIQEILHSPLIVSFIISSFLFLFSSYLIVLNSKRKLLVLSSIITIFFAGVAFAPGVSMFSANPSFMPRVYIGFGGLMYILLIIPALALQKCNSDIYKKISFVSVFIFYIGFFLFNAAMVNANTEEFNNKTRLASRIVNSLDSLDLSKNENLFITGESPRSNAAQIIRMIYPFSDKMILDTFSNGYDGGRFMLIRAGLNDFSYPDSDTRERILKSFSNREPVLRNNIFSIYDIENVTLIKF